jgi:hypothetical protein
MPNLAVTAGRYFLQSGGEGRDSEFEGLKPGEISGELREALGLCGADPPPWLWRMRRLGYPPGYR